MGPRKTACDRKVYIMEVSARRGSTMGTIHTSHLGSNISSAGRFFCRLLENTVGKCSEYMLSYFDKKRLLL